MNLATTIDRTREIARDVVAPDAERVDAEAQWPRRGLEALLAAGLGGLVIPESMGGLGHGLRGLARVCEVLGHECGSTGLCFGMHSVGASVIAAKATPDQQIYLEKICRGEHLTTLALSEPGTGVHFYFPQTRLERGTNGSYRINGTKAFVTNGSHADSCVVSTVAADPDAPIGQFSCVVVPKDAPGLIWGEPWCGLGMRGNSSRSVELHDVDVPAQNLLGSEGDQIWYVFNVIAPFFLMAMAGTYLGLATAAFEEAQRHVSSRLYAHSGSALGQVGVIQHRLGSLWAGVERTRRLIYHAAAEFDSGGPDAIPALFSAKAEVAECSVRIVNEVMTLMGGSAYQDSGRLGRLLRDARAAHVMSPTTDILRVWTGRVLLGLPILGDS